MDGNSGQRLPSELPLEQRLLCFMLHKPEKRPVVRCGANWKMQLIMFATRQTPLASAPALFTKRAGKLWKMPWILPTAFTALRQNTSRASFKPEKKEEFLILRA